MLKFRFRVACCARPIIAIAACIITSCLAIAEPAAPDSPGKPPAASPNDKPSDEPNDKPLPADIPSEKPEAGAPPAQKPASAESDSAKTKTFNISVALIDVGDIYEHHVWFKQQLQEMKFDVQDAEADLKVQSEQLKAIAAAAKGLSGDDLRTLEREFTTKQAALNLKASLQKSEF